MALKSRYFTWRHAQIHGDALWKIQMNTLDFDPFATLFWKCVFCNLKVFSHFVADAFYIQFTRFNCTLFPLWVELITKEMGHYAGKLIISVAATTLPVCCRNHVTRWSENIIVIRSLQRHFWFAVVSRGDSLEWKHYCDWLTSGHGSARMCDRQNT